MPWKTVGAVAGGLLFAAIYYYITVVIAEGTGGRVWLYGAAVYMALGGGAIYGVVLVFQFLFIGPPWSKRRREGMEMLASGRFDEAEAALAAAIALARGNGAALATILELTEMRADCLRSLGRGEAEVAARREALVLRQQAFGLSQPETGAGHGRLAEALRRTGNADEAATHESFARQLESRPGRVK